MQTKNQESGVKTITQAIKENAEKMAPNLVGKVIVAGIPSAEEEKQQTPKINKTMKKTTTTTVPENVKNENTISAAPKAEPRKSVEEEAADLQRELERKTAELQARLDELAHKQKLSANRRKFIETIRLLDEAEIDLEEETDFETHEYKISFLKGYGSNAVFSISAREVVQDFISHLRNRINEKVSELEAEIMK